jgi:hypothetical protein
VASRSSSLPSRRGSCSTSERTGILRHRVHDVVAQRRCSAAVVGERLVEAAGLALRRQQLHHVAAFDATCVRERAERWLAVVQAQVLALRRPHARELAQRAV